MNRTSHITLCVLAAVVVLTGCAKTSIQPQAFVPQSSASRLTSRLAPAAGHRNLLYLSQRSSVLVFDYGTSNLVNTLSYFTDAAGQCTDPQGDVYVTNWGAADVIEFAHGGSKPIKTLIDPSPYPIDCTFDHTTGNLAVINQYGQSQYSAGNVAIYTDAKGNPKTYKIKGLTTYFSGSYDSSGNLLVGGTATGSYTVNFAMLQRAGTGFKAVTLEKRSPNFKYPGYTRWDGQYYVIEFEYFGASLFAWYTVKNYEATQEGYTITEESGEGSGPFWLGRVGGPKSVPRANQLVGAMTIYGVMGWDYPRGGSYIFQMYNYSQAGGVSASILR